MDRWVGGEMGQMNVGAPGRKDKGTQKGFVVCEYGERTGGPGERTVIISSSVGMWLFSRLAWAVWIW